MSNRDHDALDLLRKDSPNEQLRQLPQVEQLYEESTPIDELRPLEVADAEQDQPILDAPLADYFADQSKGNDSGNYQRNAERIVGDWLSWTNEE